AEIGYGYCQVCIFRAEMARNIHLKARWPQALSRKQQLVTHVCCQQEANSRNRLSTDPVSVRFLNVLTRSWIGMSVAHIPIHSLGKTNHLLAAPAVAAFFT